MKPANPYTALKRKFTEYVNGCITRPRRTMWIYSKTNLSEMWNLSGLNERVAEAEQIGWDVQLKSTQNGLEVIYVKQIPNRPLGI